MTIRLFGTETSPYVRRVRIVAHELGLDCALVNTATDAGQAELRARSPIWKVPAAEIDGQLVFDSRVITDLLVDRYGSEALPSLSPAEVDRHNMLTVIDGALDALINCFYLGRDGVTAAAASYLAKHQARTQSAMTWLEAQVEAGELGTSSPGLVEIALATTLEWMVFRSTYPVERHSRLTALVARYKERDSFCATRPPQS